MRFFFATTNAGGAPASPTIVVSRNGNVSTTVNYTFPADYNFGKGASFGTQQNQFCNVPASCLPYTVNEFIGVGSLPTTKENTAGPLTPSLVYWNIRVTNEYGKSAVYRTASV